MGLAIKRMFGEKTDIIGLGYSSGVFRRVFTLSTRYFPPQ